MEIELCQYCKHYLGNLSCIAFENIPMEILEGKNNHSEVLEGQENDLIYEKDTENLKTIL